MIIKYLNYFMNNSLSIILFILLTKKLIKIGRNYNYNVYNINYCKFSDKKLYNVCN